MSEWETAISRQAMVVGAQFALMHHLHIADAEMLRDQQAAEDWQQIMQSLNRLGMVRLEALREIWIHNYTQGFFWMVEHMDDLYRDAD